MCWPSPGPAALHQRGEQRDGGVLGGGEVGDRHRVVLDRLGAQLGGRVEVAGLAVDEGRVGPSLPPVAASARSPRSTRRRAPGCSGASDGVVEPHDCITPGRKFSISTSTAPARRRTSVASLLLGEVDGDQPLAHVELHEAREGWDGRRREPPRVWSPSGGSSLITSAPSSASRRVQCGPATTRCRSSTRMPPAAGRAPSGSPPRRGPVGDLAERLVLLGARLAGQAEDLLGRGGCAGSRRCRRRSRWPGWTARSPGSRPTGRRRRPASRTAPWTPRPTSRWPAGDVGDGDLRDRSFEPGDRRAAHAQVRVAHDRPAGVQHGELLADVGVVAPSELLDEAVEDPTDAAVAAGRCGRAAAPSPRRAGRPASSGRPDRTGHPRGRPG